MCMYKYVLYDVFVCMCVFVHDMSLNVCVYMCICVWEYVYGLCACVHVCLLCVCMFSVFVFMSVYTCDVFA